MVLTKRTEVKSEETMVIDFLGVDGRLLVGCMVGVEYFRSMLKVLNVMYLSR